MNKVSCSFSLCKKHDTIKSIRFLSWNILFAFVVYVLIDLVSFLALRKWLKRVRKSVWYLELHCWHCKYTHMSRTSWTISTSTILFDVIVHVCFRVFSVTILVLIIESRWTDIPKQRDSSFIIENNSTCWQREEYVIISDCHPCTGKRIHARRRLCQCTRTNWLIHFSFQLSKLQAKAKVFAYTRITKKCFVVRVVKLCREGVWNKSWAYSNRSKHLKSLLFLLDSCDKVAWLDERNFWTFEAILFAVAVISTSISFLRQRSLDRKTMLKVQRQLEQSVWKSNKIRKDKNRQKFTENERN